MSLYDAFRHRLRPLVRRSVFDREMAEEFRHHLELQAQELPDADHPAARARARFGSPAYYMEETRRMTLLGWLDALRQDLRYALRNLRRAPAFTTVAVLSLAIGIGANSAIFGLLYSLLLQPLPVSHPEQLVELQHTGRESQNDIFSYNEYESLERSPGLTSLTALGGTGNVMITAGSNRRIVSVDAVAGNFFPTLGLPALRGRLIAPDDERTRAPVVVISEDLWTALFNREPVAIGSTIAMQGTAFTVIGVTSRSFQGLAYPGSFEAAVPLSTLALVGGTPAEGAGADSMTLQIVGRLADRVSAPRAAGMIDATYRSCCVEAGAAPGATGAVQASAIRLTSIEHGIPLSKFDVPAMFGRLLFELMGGAVILLLAACANVATLLLARASARERELAVRLSLGASRRRLAAQMLVESAVLATIGSVTGLVLADWALRLVAHRLPGLIVDRATLQLNGVILGFTAAVAVAAVLLFGTLPAWRATRADLIAPLKEGGHSFAARRRGTLERGVVVAQIAIALILLHGAGLFVATLRNLRDVNGGFASEHTVTAGLDARGTSYESAGLASLADGLLARAAAIPGARSVALSGSVPVFGGRRFGSSIVVEGYTPSRDELMAGWFNPVTPGYFATLGIGLHRGRDFLPADRLGGQPVAIVNEAFVHQYMRDLNPLGLTIRSLGADTILMQVVGVANDARYIDLRHPAPPMIYLPLAQSAQLPRLGQKLDLTVQTIGDDRAMSSALGNALRAEVPGLQVSGPETIELDLSTALNRETLTAELATLFGAVALIIAAIGLYGIVSYHVAQRTREIGVRMALGSSASTVVWMVLKQALILVTIGVLVGAPLALAGGKAIAAELFGLAGQNQFYVLGAGALLMTVAVAASALPARRAAKVDPLMALRAD